MGTVCGRVGRDGGGGVRDCTALGVGVGGVRERGGREERGARKCSLIYH